MAEPRLPPHDIEAEEAVIGSVLLDGDSLAGTFPLTPEDFFRDQDGLIYRACLDLFAKQTPVNQVTVAHWLKEKGQLDRIGGAGFLLHLLSQTPTPLHVTHYAAIVRDASLRRRVIAAAKEIARIAQEPGDSLPSRAFSILTQIVPRQDRHILGPKDLAEEAFRALTERRQKKDEALSFGLPALDRATGGMERGSLTLLGARPSLGKTTLLQQVARHNARRGLPILFVSCEMAPKAIADRELVARTALPIQAINSGDLEDREWQSCQEAIGHIAEEPFHYFGSQVTTADILAQTQRLQLEMDLALVVVDYIQLLCDRQNNLRDSANDRITYISRQLKLLATERQVAVLAASQLNRALEAREEKRPRLSDLRESGALEQDADLVLALHRDDAYMDETELEQAQGRKGSRRKALKQGMAEIGILKHRQWGNRNTWIKLLWLPKNRIYGEPVGEGAMEQKTLSEEEEGKH